MAKTGYVITYRKNPYGMGKTVQAAVPEALRKIGVTWHTTMLPKHFRVGASARYKYAERSTKYKKNKQKKEGHNLPLVYSGLMRNLVTSAATIITTPKRLSIVMEGNKRALAGEKPPRKHKPINLFQYLAFSFGGGRVRKMPNLAAEITAMADDESQILLGMLERDVTEVLERPDPLVVQT